MKAKASISNFGISVEELKNISSGVYFLEIESEKKFTLNTPRFSHTIFPGGFYYYVGSAQKNLSHRVIRHIKKSKNIHWHIDYLTSLNDVLIKSVYILPNHNKDVELELALNFENEFSCRIAAESFGNSDSKKSKSHLFYSPILINQSHFISRYQSIVRFIPSSKEIA